MKKKDRIIIIEGIEYKFKADSKIRKCFICNKLGEASTCLENNLFIFRINELTKDARETFEKNGTTIDQKYTHLFVGGYGSKYFDFECHFLTKDQAAELPKHVCDECLRIKLKGKKTFSINYGTGETRMKKLNNKKGGIPPFFNC